MFRALVLNQTGSDTIATVKELSESDLPRNHVSIDVKYSSLNYKDALAVTGKGKIVRGDFPFVPGVDLTGEVTASETPKFLPGDRVIGNGWGLGEADWGGLAERACVRESSLIPMPEGLSYEHAMILGTAGFTAMLSVMALEEHGVTPDGGEIVVTGATGGVGSISIVLLSRIGYNVVASTGKSDKHAYLQKLGAARVIDRSVLGEGPQRPLDQGKWAGAIDSVGGPALATLISQMKRHGSIASCGLANSPNLETTVFPFILRGVNLLGIDSATCTYDRRCIAWTRLQEEMPASAFEQIGKVVPLADVPDACESMIAGKTLGRIAVNVNL